MATIEQQDTPIVPLRVRVDVSDLPEQFSVTPHRITHDGDHPLPEYATDDRQWRHPDARVDSDEGIDHPTVGFGALKTLRWADGTPVADGRNRGQWRALKDVVGDLIDDGVFTEQETIGYMKAKVITWARPEEDLIIRTVPHSDGP